MARRTQIAGALLLQAAGLYAIWLLIDDNVSQPELFTGIAVALLSLTLAVVVRRSSTVRIRVRPAMLRYAYRLPSLLVADSVRVCGVVLRALVLRRPIHGRLRAARYRSSGDAEAALGRRVLTEWAASIAPNRYVIGIDIEAGVLLVHELVETKGPVDPLELG